jgi:Putative restriction endonuclease
MVTTRQHTSKRERILPPLENGDHLDQKTFHQRYEAMPSGTRAELIGGIVYMSSPQKNRHGRYDQRFSRWLDEYEDATPGTEVLPNTTCILGTLSELQPDAFLRILTEYGGQTREDEDGYTSGAPEWVGEISDSTESIDLHSKKLDYEKAGVREYVVAAVRSQEAYWFYRWRGKFKELAADSDGIFRSRVFAGLWLDSQAFLARDRKRLLAVLHQGLATPEHAAFVAKLASKKQ